MKRRASGPAVGRPIGSSVVTVGPAEGRVRRRAGRRRLSFAAALTGCGPVAFVVAFLVVFLVAFAPARGGAYRFGYPGSAAWSAENSIRWNASAWPVRFRLLENENLARQEVFADSTAWREFVTAALDQWNAVPTSEAVVELAEEAAAQDAAVDEDGVNTIGFSSVFEDEGILAAGFASWDYANEGELRSCDVELNPEVAQRGTAEERLDRLTALVLHEVGHCLGLLHTVVMPMPYYRTLSEVDLTGFYPDPTMSYGRDGPFLMRDDMVGVSLLYPAPGFRAATASFSGTVVFDDGTAARHAYVQAVEISEEGARAGPGAFADGEGRFLLEGVRPGSVMLWVHPMLILSAHHFPGEWALSFQDQWLWADARAGAMEELPEIRVFRGRGSAR